MTERVGTSADKYFGLFASLEDVRAHFQPDANAVFPTDEEVLYAEYDYEDYSGSAFVLFKRDGKLFEVNAGHCSCFGLEEQWTPEETSIEAVAMRPFAEAEIRAEAVRAALEKAGAV